MSRHRRLASARLYLIAATDRVDVAEAALGGGVDVVQLRDKRASDDEIVAAGRKLRAACDRHGALLIVNDRPDLALACDADGVHLGQDDEPLESARRTLGPDRVIGVSTHTPGQVVGASGADYLGVGPVYATPTKPGVRPVGLELVRAALRLTGQPLFAIGGIDRVRVQAVAAAGATRVAVVRAICDAQDPAAAARSLVELLEGALVGR